MVRQRPSANATFQRPNAQINAQTRHIPVRIDRLIEVNGELRSKTVKQEFIDPTEATLVEQTDIGQKLADIVRKATGKTACKRAKNVQIPAELMGDAVFFGA